MSLKFGGCPNVRLILLRIFVRIRMLDHTHGGLAFLHDPRTISWRFSKCRRPACRSRRRAGLGRNSTSAALDCLMETASDVHCMAIILRVPRRQDAALMPARWRRVALLLFESGAKQCARRAPGAESDGWSCVSLFPFQAANHSLIYAERRPLATMADASATLKGASSIHTCDIRELPNSMG